MNGGKNESKVHCTQSRKTNAKECGVLFATQKDQRLATGEVEEGRKEGKKEEGHDYKQGRGARSKMAANLPAFSASGKQTSRSFTRRKKVMLSVDAVGLRDGDSG